MVKIEMSREKKTLVGTILVSLLMILFAILTGDIGIVGNVIILSVLLISIPQLIFSYVSYRELRDMELRFPSFMRDLVESTRAGLPLHKSIISASRNDYGPLNKEIKKMSNQLSWNINIIKVLEQSRERLKRSDTLNKVMRVMIETYKSGGSVDDTLNSLSLALSTIQETEKERKSTLSQYVVAMYVITFVFIGIVVGINRLLVPIFSSGGLGAGGVLGGLVGNPCEPCLYTGGLACTPCGLYFNVCSLMGVSSGTLSCYYLALFYSMSAVQAITGGLVAGQIGEGSVKAGIKHSLILFILATGTFFILVRIGLLGG